MTKKEIRLIEITLIVDDPAAYSKARLKQDIKNMEDQGYRVARVRRVFG